MKCIAISSGGTAGHINPALSIARKLAEKGWQIHYLGNKDSLEEKLLAKTDFSFYKLDVQKIYRRLTLAHLKFPVKLLTSITRSRQVMKQIKPDVFLGCGGFVCGPPGFAAHLLGIPIVLQEQNSYPGLTTRLLSRYSDMIFLGNKHASNHLKKAKSEYSGNPISYHPCKEKERNNAAGRNTIFLVGGSQGSLALNNMMVKVAKPLLEQGINIIWQTGMRHYRKLQEIMGEQEGLTLFEYSTEIDKHYHNADIVIARAGALTLAELETLHKPAILIPLPTSAENHQVFNAREQVEKGIAEIIEQKDLTPETLIKFVNNMLNKITEYESNFGETLHAGAAEHIAAYIDRNYGRK